MSVSSLLTAQNLIIIQGALAGFLLLFFVMSRDYTKGIYVWLLSIIFFKYYRLDLADSLFPDLSIDRILFLFLCFVIALNVLTKRLRIKPLTGIEYSMFIFCFMAVISMFVSGLIVKQGGRLNIGELLTGYIFPFTMFFIAKNVYDDNKKREGFLKFIMFTGTYLVFTAMAEHYRMDSLVWPKYILNPYFGIHFGRARGPFVQAAVNGTFLGMVFLSAFYFIFHHERKIFSKITAMVMLFLTPIAVFFTYTRGCWLAAFAGFTTVCIFFLKRRRQAFLAVIFIVCLAVIFSLSFVLNDDTIAFALERTNSRKPVYDRLNLYMTSFNMFFHNPLFGAGFGRFFEKAPEYYEKLDFVSFHNRELKAHDTFVGILAEMGLVGFGLILFIYFSILKRSVLLYRRLGDFRISERNLTAVFWAFIPLYVINAVFIDMRYFELINSLLFIYAGIICGMQHEVLTEDECL